MTAPSTDLAPVCPSSEGEVAELLREASAASRPVRVLPGHGGLPGTLFPDPHHSGPDPLHLSLEKLDQLHEHEPADLTATVGAGLELHRFADILLGAGQWLPVDAPGWPSRRVGGVVAGGRWGPLHVGYGTPRDHVLGATLVTGDGRIIPLGGKVVKNVAGFDLLRLVVGSRGELGVVVRATVRLYPRPEADRTLLFPCADHRELHRMALRLAGLPAAPAALEVLGGGSARGAAPHGVVPGRGTVALRLAGTPGEVEALSLLATGATGSPAEAELSGDDSRSFQAALTGGVTGGAPWARLSVLPSHLPELVGRLSPLLALLDQDPEGWWGTHVRGGILRMVFPPALAGDPHGDAVALLRGAAEWAEGVGGGIRTGGGVTGGAPTPSRGVGTGRVHRLREGIRRVFDPAGVMRPLPQWHP